MRHITELYVEKFLQSRSPNFEIAVEKVIMQEVYKMANVSELKKDFTRLIEKNNLAHGYLLHGSLTGNKFSFARSLANYLENKEWRPPSKILTDALIIDQAAEPIGIDAARSITNFLWQKPIRSSKRTLIINNAANLTPEAQNAILKIAEEPPAHALIILLVNNPETLLPTVVSRFQKIFINDTNIRMSTNDPSTKARLSAGHGTNDWAKEFLKALPARRKEIIKEIIEDDGKLEDFVTGLISELRRDIMNNWKIIRELLKRWTLIKQYNTNKRLQLEAWTRLLS